MLKTNEFYNLLTKLGINFYAGVPNTLMHSFCDYVQDNAKNHFICANEGNAVGMGIGHYLAKGEIPCIYLENSGLGNALNPIYSLADSEVYSIPMLILVGWRGESGTDDGHEFKKLGKILLPSFGASEVHYDLLPSDTDRAKAMITSVMSKVRDEKCPYFLIVKKGAFEAYQSNNLIENNYNLSHEDVISKVLEKFSNAKIIASTGQISKELFASREKLGQNHHQDFLTIGAHGHCSSIALAIANTTNKEVICLDADANALMQLGSMAIAGQARKENFKHIILNSGVHNSVISQPTVGHKVNFRRIAKSCGYRDAMIVECETQLKEALEFLKNKGPLLLDIRVNLDYRKELSYPKLTPKELKKLFTDRFNE